MMKTRFHYSDDGAIKARDLFPNVGGGHTQNVAFNRTVVGRINRLYMTSPVLSTAVNQFKAYVTRSDLNITGAGSSLISKAQMEREILPAINTMILEWILYGYTNVCVGESRVAPGRPTLVVVPFMFVQQTMKWDDNWQVRYTAETMYGSDKDAGRVHVLCVYPPDERGMPTSPIAQCITHLGYAEHLWGTYITGTERGVNPPYLLMQEKNTGSSLPGIDRMPFNASLITSGGIGQVPMDKIVQHAEKDAAEHTDKVLKAAQSHRDELLRAQRLQLEQIKASVQPDTAFDTERVLLGTLRAQLESDPLKNMYVAPAGHTIGTGPEFKTPAEFTKVVNMVAEELYRALGLPIIMLQSRADTSSNVEFAINILNENVVRFQRVAAPLIAEALDIVFSAEVERERANVKLAKKVLAIVDTGQVHLGDSDDEEEDMEPLQPRLSVSFVINPLTTFELVQQVYGTGAITEEAFQDLIMSILNLPSTSKRPRMAEWLKKQQEMGAASSTASSSSSKRPRKR